MLLSRGVVARASGGAGFMLASGAGFMLAHACSCLLMLATRRTGASIIHGAHGAQAALGDKVPPPCSTLHLVASM
jgi:hypothetical protein